MNTLLCFAPLSKSRIDKAKRMVWGIAQVQDIKPDVQGDIVTYNATLNAFSQWPGNVREMHQPVAVGKRVQAIPLPGQKAMLVGVRISEGAEDTWQKILDGTLSGFSIGGYATKTTKKFDAKLGKHVNYIEEYVLTELSLVDSPANPRCKITGIEKRSNGALVASDVLGDIQTGGHRNVGKINAAAAQNIQKFASATQDTEQFVLVKQSDLTTVNGQLAIGKAAELLRFNKADMDGDGYDENGNTQPDGGNGLNTDDVDLEGHAKSAYNLHNALHKMAGSECKCGANDATGGDDTIGDLGKGGGLNVKVLDGLIQKAVGNALDGITKSLDELAQKTGTTLAARKGAEGGTVIAKDAVVTAGALVADTARGNISDNDLTALRKNIDDLRTESQALIKKRDAGHELSSTEKLRIDTLGNELMRAKTLLAEAERGSISKVA